MNSTKDQKEQFPFQSIFEMKVGNMNQLNETLREINVTIEYYKRKKLACEQAIKELESHRNEIMEKYDLVVE